VTSWLCVDAAGSAMVADKVQNLIISTSQ